MYLEQNRLGEALELFQEARSIDIAAAKEHHPDHVFVLHNLALTHTYLNNEPAAESFFERALTLAKRLNHQMRARVELHYGILKCRMENYSEGRQHLQFALDVLNKSPNEQSQWISLANHFNANCLADKDSTDSTHSAFDAILAKWGGD